MERGGGRGGGGLGVARRGWEVGEAKCPGERMISEH